MTDQFYIWQGIYPSFDEAAASSSGDGFEGEVYNKRTREAADECLGSLKSGLPIPAFHKQRSNVLPPVAAMMLKSRERLSILDFGGGLGIGYLTLAESIPRCSEFIEYTIVELPSVCAQGREIYSDEITFLPCLPEGREFDLVHSASALQYVEDWQDLLEKLCSYSPEYVLLSDVFAGSNPAFVSLQNYYNSRIRHWFLNLGELESVISSLGYRLVLRSFVNSKRLDTHDVLPMDNFPASHRIDRTLHLLFERVEDRQRWKPDPRG